MRTPAWVVSITAMLVLGALARGQSADELRGQVERLAGQVRDLTAQLAASQRQAERLQAERDDLIARLKTAEQMIAALRRGGAPPPPPRASVPDDPYASPASLLGELIRRYGREVASLPGAGAEDEAARTQHRRDVAKWCEQAARQLHGRGAWVVRLTDTRPTDDPDYESMLVTVIDETSGLPIDEPFRSDVPRRVVQRMERERRARRADDAPWRATVQLTADPRFNPERVEPGPYNIPPFIGPYAEFGYRLEWQSITPLESKPPPPPTRDGG